MEEDMKGYMLYGGEKVIILFSVFVENDGGR